MSLLPKRYTSRQVDTCSFKRCRLLLALDDATEQMRVVNQATTQGVARILLADCAKFIGGNSEVNDCLDRNGLRMLLHGKFEF